jgi:hypothetical protein
LPRNARWLNAYPRADAAWTRSSLNNFFVRRLPEKVEVRIKKEELRIVAICRNDRYMKQLLVVVLTVLATLSPVRANLGDGGDRIDDSYRNLVERHLRDDGTVSTLYHKDRYLYFVVFDSGVSVLERYSHVKGDGLSEKEIARFLKANAAGATWLPDNKAKERRFKRSDGKAEATYATVDGRLTLTVRTKEGRTRSDR